ncbi:helix-turn-helix transcriptional regulator [Paenibacillus ehimensis]|uniref:helix-turn-helix domain-containing protein n=1 Tax=Paenibacillus ehimensis TaxID=79264 RepID=UPI002DB62BDB|nr:helix-turn-helix transcriptional regulator [Paenibacillus ehimensis]MEC0210982.1 helix-turn-helix transcriptional regulator [Paenibacillus ehimensis]
MLQLGEKVKYIRKTNQLNQKDFADRIGVSQGTLSDIERGNCYPSCEPIIALKKAFKCDLNWLIDDEPESSSDQGLFHVSFSQEEISLIELLRSLPAIEKDELLQIFKIKAVKNNIRYPKYKQ